MSVVKILYTTTEAFTNDINRHRVEGFPNNDKILRMFRGSGGGRGTQKLTSFFREKKLINPVKKITFICAASFEHIFVLLFCYKLFHVDDSYVTLT